MSHVPEVLEAEAAAVRKMLDAYDKAIGQLTMARDDARHMLVKLEGRLRDSTPPERSRYVSPLGDRRERPVPCSLCRHPTAALDALCDPCHDRAQGYTEDARGGAA